MAEKGAELVVRWLADVSGLEHGAAKAEAATEKTSSKFSKLGLAAKAGAVGGVLLLAEGLNKSVEAAEKDQVATARLENAFKAAHVALAPYKDRLEAAEHAGARLGFTGEQVNDSIGSLVVATHDGKTAIGDLAAAEDIARFKHIDLAAATKMLVMAQTGSQRATKQLGLEVQATTVHQDRAKFAYKAADDAIKAQFKSMGTLTQAQQDQEDALRNNLKLKYDADKVDAKIQDHQVTGAQVTEMVTQKLHGQADAYADTAEGARARLGAALDELEVKVGQKLLPILTKLTIWLADNLPRAMERLSQFWKAHGDQIIAIANKVEAVLVPTFRMIADAIRLVADLLQGHWSRAWADAKRLVIDYIDAMKARIMLQIQIIESIFGGLAGKVADALAAFGKAVREALNESLAFVRSLPRLFYNEAFKLGKQLVAGILDGLVGLGSALKHKIEGTLSSVLSSIDIPGLSPPRHAGAHAIGKPLADGIIEGFVLGMSGFQKTVEGIIGIGIAAGQGALEAGFQSMYSAVGDFAQRLFDEINAAVAAAALEAARRLGEGLGSGGSPGGGLSGGLPHYASGGIVTKPTVLLAGERGPEAIVPLNRGFGGGGTTIVNFNGPVFGDKKKVAREIVDEIHDALIAKQRGGSLGFA